MTLESRIPEIIAKLPDNVGKGLVHGLKPIASAMGAHAPDRSDDEPREFHAGPVKAGQSRSKAMAAEITAADAAAAVFADDWQWFFAEYGTAHGEPARPFMRPAVEAGREKLNAAVVEKLNRL